MSQQIVSRTYQKDGTWKPNYATVENKTTVIKPPNNNGGNTKPKQEVAPKRSTAPIEPPAKETPKSEGGGATQKVIKKSFILEGSAEVIADPNVVAGTCVNFQGLGNHFSGRYFVKRVSHTWSKGGYTQSLEVERNTVEDDFIKRTAPAQAANRQTKVLADLLKDNNLGNVSFYTLKSGDNTWKELAKKFYGDETFEKLLIKANVVDTTPSSKNLFVGRKIKVPFSDYKNMLTKSATMR